MSRQEEFMITLPNRSEITLHTTINTAEAGNRRPTLLLLHFWGGSNRTFSPLILQLQHEFNIIAPSLRGWGRSSKPEDPGAYRIADWVEDIVQLIAYMQTARPTLLANGLFLVGHSIGGKIAQVLLSRPEVGGILKGLVLLAPAPAGSFRLPTREMQEQQMHAFDDTDSARFVVENVLLGYPTAVSESKIAALAADGVCGGAGVKKALPNYGMVEDYEDVVKEAVESKCRGGTLKMLVIVGSLDRVEVPANVQERVVNMLRDGGAKVTLKTLDDVGHLMPVEAPQMLAECTVNFLESSL